MRDLIFGDFHINGDKVYFKTLFERIYSWLDSVDIKKSDRVILLGDVFHKGLSAGADHYYAQKVCSLLSSKAKDVYIITGNHDVIQSYTRITRQTSNALNALRVYDNVHIIEQPSVLNLNRKYLMLPFIPGIGNCEKYYNNYDWSEYLGLDQCTVLGHLAVKGTSVFIDGFDIYRLNEKIDSVEYSIFGHIHTCSEVNNNGIITKYLGSIYPLDRTQQGHPSVYAIVDEEGNLTYNEIPRFITYETVQYPNLPISKDKLTVLTVNSDTDDYDESIYKDYYVQSIEVQKAQEEETTSTLDLMKNISFKSLIDLAFAKKAMKEEELTRELYLYSIGLTQVEDAS